MFIDFRGGKQTIRESLRSDRFDRKPSLFNPQPNKPRSTAAIFKTRAPPTDINIRPAAHSITADCLFNISKHTKVTQTIHSNLFFLENPDLFTPYPREQSFKYLSLNINFKLYTQKFYLITGGLHLYSKERLKVSPVIFRHLTHSASAAEAELQTNWAVHRNQAHAVT